jgi:DNA-binding IclR family transcriptional regulator
MAPPAGGVHSLERGLHLIQLLGDGREVPLSHVVEASGLARSTVLRLLRSLVALGYVRRSPGQTYALAPRFAYLAECSARGLLHRVRPASMVARPTTAPVPSANPVSAGRTRCSRPRAEHSAR